ncbi:methyl-accepting chemotaxis protein [Fulvivirga lutimaris]|uniref:methyl-accepting chemotaxis protein n=1 Tax=Fulvivirga lutimaris TaxID=1819566 RepID=UPI0012BC42EE|nr:methyl-accepting chemotaxis protein [Fulvivirga lutimaris]MTI39891.1 methyl-accepting chemotaxis protein [Fulvivirga lutimaris]
MKTNIFKLKKIKSKLLLAFGTVLLLSSFLAGWGYYSINRILEIRKVKEEFMTINEVVLKMRKAEKDFLMREVINEDFMQTGESKYITAINDYTADQDSIISFLQNNSWSTELGIKDDLGILLTSINGYHDTFTKIANAYQVRGFKNFGNEGELRAAIKSIENADYNVNMVRLLMLRRHEKDFFLRKDLSYVEKFDAEIEAFLNELGRASYNDDIRAKIDTYETKFHEVVDAEERIGFDEKSGLMGEMRGYVHQIEPVVDNLLVLVDEQTDNITFNTTITFIGVFVAQLIIGIFLAMMFSNVLTTNILSIKNAALKLAEGIIPEPVKVSTEDELGDTQKSVNEVIRSLKDSISVANLVSKGNLHSAKKEATTKLKDGELDSALKNMIAKLTEIVQSITKGADEITLGSSEISKSSQVVAEGATEQASSLEEISASVEQMVSNINQNAENSAQAEDITKGAADKMTTVKAATQSTFDSIKEITEKIEIINVIADKTNLLAINAAVEAARAGEHGKGFAVVANEVRKLAERSQTSAEGIISLSKNCIKEAQNSSELLDQLSPEVLKSFDLVREISSSSIEQRSGAEQINAALSQLNQVTQQNASSSEELSSSSHNFNNQAEKLTQTVSFFKLDEKEESKSKKSQIISQIEMLKSILGEDYTNTNVSAGNYDAEEEVEVEETTDNEEPKSKLGNGLKIKLDDDSYENGMGITLENFDEEVEEEEGEVSKSN